MRQITLQEAMAEFDADNVGQAVSVSKYLILRLLARTEGGERIQKAEWVYVELP